MCECIVPDTRILLHSENKWYIAGEKEEKKIQKFGSRSICYKLDTGTVTNFCLQYELHEYFLSKILKQL
jgi:hypothetical protein